MTKRFGKYRSRAKKKGAGIQDVAKEVVRVAKNVPKVAKRIAKVAKKIPVDDVLRVAKKIPEGIRIAKDIYKELKPEAPEGGSLFQSFGDMFQSARPSGGSHRYIDSFQDGVSEHGMDYLKSAAAHVLNEHHDGPPILYHHHNVKSDTRHFNRILHSTKNELHKAMRGNPLLKEAVSDAMHVAEKGGGIHWEHETGGSLENATKLAQGVVKLGNPIAEGEKAVAATDKIDMHDWSARGIAKNSMYAWSANVHAQTAKVKADAILFPEMQPFAQAGSAFGDQISKWGSYI